MCRAMESIGYYFLMFSGCWHLKRRITKHVIHSTLSDIHILITARCLHTGVLQYSELKKYKVPIIFLNGLDFLRSCVAGRNLWKPFTWISFLVLLYTTWTCYNMPNFMQISRVILQLPCVPRATARHSYCTPWTNRCFLERQSDEWWGAKDASTEKRAFCTLTATKRIIVLTVQAEVVFLK